MPRQFRKYRCYQASIQLGAEIIPFARNIRPFRVGEQIASSALSISSNIAEGSYYKSDKDFIRFLRYALGSSAELSSQLEVMRRSGEIIPSYDKWLDEIEYIQKMLSGLISTISSDS